MLVVSLVRKSAGHTLIEALVALGILSLIALGSATFYQWSRQSGDQLDRTSEVEELHGRIAVFVRDNTQCSAALSGMSFATTPLTITQLKDKTGAVAFQTGVPLPPRNLQISSMQLAGFHAIDSEGFLERGLATLNLTYLDPNVKAGQVNTHYRSLPMMVTRDTTATKTISICGDLPYENWFAQSGTSNIYSLLPIAIGPATASSTFVPATNSALEVTNFPVSIGDQSATGIRLTIDQVQAGGLTYNTFTTTQNASLRFLKGIGQPTPTNLLTFNGGKMGFFADAPLSAWLEVGQRPATLGALNHLGINLTVKQFWEMWGLTQSNDGNSFKFQRMNSSDWTAAQLHGNFVLTNSVLGVDPALSGPPPGVTAATLFWVKGKAGGGSAWWSPSDRRLKTDLERIQNPGERLDLLRPVSYQFKKSSDQSRQLGFIAQEVRKVLPDLVVGEEGSLGLKTDELVALLVETIKAEDSALTAETEELDGLLHSICEKHPEDKVCQKL